MVDLSEDPVALRAEIDRLVKLCEQQKRDVSAMVSREAKAGERLNAVRERLATARALATQAIHDAFDREEKAISGGGSPYTSIFRRTILATDVDNALEDPTRAYYHFIGHDGEAICGVLPADVPRCTKSPGHLLTKGREMHVFESSRGVAAAPVACDHKGIGEPGCPICDVRTVSEGGPRPDAPRAYPADAEGWRSRALAAEAKLEAAITELGAGRVDLAAALKRAKEAEFQVEHLPRIDKWCGDFYREALRELGLSDYQPAVGHPNAVIDAVKAARAAETIARAELTGLRTSAELAVFEGLGQSRCLIPSRALHAQLIALQDRLRPRGVPATPALAPVKPVALPEIATVGEVMRKIRELAERTGALEETARELAGPPGTPLGDRVFARHPAPGEAGR